MTPLPPAARKSGRANRPGPSGPDVPKRPMKMLIQEIVILAFLPIFVQSTSQIHHGGWSENTVLYSNHLHPKKTTTVSYLFDPSLGQREKTVQVLSQGKDPRP